MREIKFRAKETIKVRGCKSEPMFMNTPLIFKVIGNIYDEDTL